MSLVALSALLGVTILDHVRSHKIWALLEPMRFCVSQDSSSQLRGKGAMTPVSLETTDSKETHTKVRAQISTLLRFFNICHSENSCNIRKLLSIYTEEQTFNTSNILCYLLSTMPKSPKPCAIGLRKDPFHSFQKTIVKKQM